MGLFDYPTLIKKPMDLGSVKRNINGRKYKSIPDASGRLYIYIYIYIYCFVPLLVLLLLLLLNAYRECNTLQ
jgi:hypothetical protein